jgi:hypothetical protein
MKDLKQQLNWDVTLEPIHTLTGVLNERVAIVRNDTGKLLGVRSDRYRPFFNQEFEALVQRISSHSGFEFVGYEEFNHGKRILAFFENKQKNFSLCGVAVKDYLIIGNSHDASSKLFVSTSSYMFRCENQFSEKIRSFERMHTSGLNPNDIKIDELINTYELGRKELYSKMERLKNVRVDLKLINRLALQLLKSEPATEMLTDNIGSRVLVNSKKNVLFLKCIEQEIRELGPTLWGVFNGVTRYTSNHLKGNQGFGVTNGLGERMNREALLLMSEFIDE